MQRLSEQWRRTWLSSVSAILLVLLVLSSPCAVKKALFAFLTESGYGSVTDHAGAVKINHFQGPGCQWQEKLAAVAPVSNKYHGGRKACGFGSVESFPAPLTSCSRTVKYSLSICSAQLTQSLPLFIKNRVLLI